MQWLKYIKNYFWKYGYLCQVFHIINPTKRPLAVFKIVEILPKIRLIHIRKTVTILAIAGWSSSGRRHVDDEEQPSYLSKRMKEEEIATEVAYEEDEEEEEDADEQEQRNWEKL